MRNANIGNVGPLPSKKKCLLSLEVEEKVLIGLQVEAMWPSCCQKIAAKVAVASVPLRNVLRQATHGKGTVLSGWIPVLDTMHAIPGESFELCRLIDGDCEGFLPSMDEFLNSRDLGDLVTNKALQYLLKLIYEYIHDTYKNSEPYLEQNEIS
uniref:Uncharacterized protein n=1 Tax=Glossina palpalis gambiensis TaxID=67801 RepID=A0A1B0C426_9MUSC